MKQVEVASTSIKTEYFGSLTERMNKYREDVLNKKPYIDAERAVLATKAYDRYKEQPNVLKRAYMLKEILENMTIYIEDESMIAGNQASSNKDVSIFPEYTLEFVLKELDLFENGMVTSSILRKKRKSSSVVSHRSGKIITYVQELELFYLKKYLLYGNRILRYGREDEFRRCPLSSQLSKLLQYGLKGFEERARQAKAALDLTDPASIDKYHFYDSIFIVVDAVKTYAQRLWNLLNNLLKQQLLNVRRNCLKLQRFAQSSIRACKYICRGCSVRLVYPMYSSD